MSATEKHWATWILDGVVAIGAAAQIAIGIVLICQLKAYEDSNDLTRQSIDLNKKNFNLTSESVALTQKSIELNQRSIDLTQKSLDLNQESVKAAQQALEYARKANDISEKGMETANTPSVSIMILDARKVDQNRIKVSYILKNHSPSIANYVDVECFLSNQVALPDEPIDPSFFGNRHSVMPNASFQSFVWFVTDDNGASEVMRKINDGETDIDILIQYKGPLGNESNFFEVFKKSGDDFGIVNLEPDVDFDSLFKKFLNGALGMKGQGVKDSGR